MIEPGGLHRVGVVGAGAIGVSWTALLLQRGLEVLLCDPDQEAREAAQHQVATLAPGADRSRLDIGDDLAELAWAADLVIECGPERLEIKRSLFASLDAEAGPEVLLTSSSSGIGPSAFQDACRRHPERVLVAHPFNPPHLVPLVEVVGGSATSPEAVASAMRLFTHLGKQPIHLRRELPGHVANRLQAALWREAYHLVDTGVVSVADIDTAISAGPGLRWALLGPFATQHLSGGRGGIAHVLAHLGPPMLEWWHDLGEPELSPELVSKIVAGVTDELAGGSGAELAARRDAALRELLALKTRHGLSEEDPS